MRIEDASMMVFALLADRAHGATICPSEVARQLAGASCADKAESWRGAMPLVHEAVDRLVGQGRVRLSWKGRALKARSGPYRIGLAV